MDADDADFEQPIAPAHAIVTAATLMIVIR
jgi:hypothetical protein